MTVRFDDKDATVRYVPGKVTLDQIIKRYDDTPFSVVPVGPVVTVARGGSGTLRAWAERERASDKKAKAQRIQLSVEFAGKGNASPNLSLAKTPAAGLALAEKFRQVKTAGTKSMRFVAKLRETVSLVPGEISIPVRVGKKDTFPIVLRTPKPVVTTASAVTTGAALVGGTLDLRLGHLCDHKGCVHHFHKALSTFPGLAAVRPHPSLTDPCATVYLRAKQPVDVWNLRESLRRQSIEITAMTPRDLSAYRVRVELPRWREGKANTEIQQCASCRERAADVVKKLAWANDIRVAGGGVQFRPKNVSVDLVTLLDKITATGVAPAAVWLVPASTPMPKPLPPRTVLAHKSPMRVGSVAHPLIEFDLTHTCKVGTDAASLLHQQKWASRSDVSLGETVVARAWIADRKFANVTPLLSGLRTAGYTTRAIRLRDFGDIRVQLDFAHICGDVVYSKPPRRKKKSKSKKPFVPQPISMAKSSNGRKAIHGALQKVPWIKNGLFYDYHTRFEFRGGPRRITFALQARGEDVVRLDQMIDALRQAGYPPKSVTVSRRFPGIPFGKPLPGDLTLTDTQGKKHQLGSFQKPKRPLVVAFVSLNTKSRSKYRKYKAEPKLFQRLRSTIAKYKDRVDFVAVRANDDDKFADVVKFWNKTGVAIPLLNDATGMARAVFNAQITPPPHFFVFDADGQHRYAGDPHNQWQTPGKKHDDYLAKALDRVLARKFLDNGAVFYNKSVCNCSHPGCRCPKCGCGSTCRCAIKHCGVGF